MKCLRVEANQWFKRLTLIPNRTQVILGLGAGIHVLEFAKQTEGPIFVIDPRRPLVAEFFSRQEFNPVTQPEFRRIHAGSYEQILPLLEGRRFQVQQYRPCWNSFTEDFITILDSLNLRHPTTASAKHSIEQMPPYDLVSLSAIKSTDDKILLLQELIQ
ncbi:MAG: hypothetical protein IPK04_04580 [Bdellovibrionales bacterium]|nr:hypothetical protein [Bdellovibrionales bacterium]